MRISDWSSDVCSSDLPAWAALNPQRRARVLFNFKAVIEAHKEELAHLLSSEHGKVVSDAHGDVQRGLDVVEFACGAPHLLKGEFTEGAGRAEEHTSELQSLMRNSYAVFCLKKQTTIYYTRIS